MMVAIPILKGTIVLTADRQVPSSMIKAGRRFRASITSSTMARIERQSMATSMILFFQNLVLYIRYATATEAINATGR